MADESERWMLARQAKKQGGAAPSSDLVSLRPAAAAAPAAYDFDVPFRGEPVDIKPFLGKANIFVNVKFDDPESTQQMPGLQDLVSKYASEGLHVLAFPTDQGWFEADDSNTLRIKFKQVYNFGQYPTAVVRRLPLLNALLAAKTAC